MQLSADLARLLRDAQPRQALFDATFALNAAWADLPARREASELLSSLNAPTPCCEGALEQARAFMSSAAADRVAAAALAMMTGAQADHPLVALPLRHFSNGVVHSLVIASCGVASLTLSLLDGRAHASRRNARAPDIASFMPGRLWLRVLAGAADIRQIDCAGDGALNAAPARINAGDLIEINGADQALLIDKVPRFVVTLRLFVRDEAALARDVDMASGTSVHQASARERDTRTELSLALLRSMERADSAPLAATLAQDASLQTSLRWQAAREAVAMDSSVGVPLLKSLAADPAEPLGKAAIQTLAVLRQRYPELV